MEIRYRNTDLDLVSARDLSVLNRAIEHAGLIKIADHQDGEGSWHATFEVIGDEDDNVHDNAEATIIAMLDVIERLHENARVLFDQGQTKEFNMAYDIGTEPNGFSDVLSPATLARIVELDASVRFTLYTDF